MIAELRVASVNLENGGLGDDGKAVRVLAGEGLVYVRRGGAGTFVSRQEEG